ncbi:MAG: hypothetical protein AAF355_02515 [Myxococcota bacterium]
MTCIFSLLLAVFVPTFFRTIRSSKISEASEQLASLYRRTAVYFETASSATGQHQCLPKSAGPTPLRAAAEPVEVDFLDADRSDSEVWAALGFHPERATRYRYSFLPKEHGCGQSTLTPNEILVTLRAEGDLDEDGTLSTFERHATTTSDGLLAPVGILYVVNRVE